jgi:hypothetical protein
MAMSFYEELVIKWEILHKIKILLSCSVSYFSGNCYLMLIFFSVLVKENSASTGG